MPDEPGVPPTQSEADKLVERLFLSRPAGKLTFSLFIIATLFFAHESVPVWAFWDFGYSADAYVVLCGSMGLLAGFVGAERQFLGALAGGLCGAGSIMAIVVLLSLTNTIPNLAVLLALFAGLFPGCVFYWLGEKMLGRPHQKSDASEMDADADRFTPE